MKEQTVSHAILREMQHQTLLLQDIRKQTRKIQGTLTAVILFVLFLGVAGCGIIVLGAITANSTY